MKLVAWNCNMAFRKKAPFILSYQPDILIVSECENLQRLQFTNGLELPHSSIWHGKNPHKGIGVFSFNNYKLELLGCHNPDFKNILPISVTGGKVDFILFAIWANNPEDKDGAYVTQIWKAFHYYEDLFTNNKIILAGDFNSNTNFDKPKREGNHSALVARLEDKQIYSTYHKFYNQIQGKEEHPTWFMYRHKDKPYHFDFCFASIDFIKKMTSVEIGKYEDWTIYSDHKPIMVEFDISN